MIKIQSLTVQVGDFQLNNINLEIAREEYFIVLGPTGAGKTVLLESIAGLNPLRQGRIWLAGQEITDSKPEDRGISIVYQDHALFPHLSVKDNILFGLKLRKQTKGEMRSALDWLSGLLEIGHLLNRRPETLSGGERQKVALARALSTRPAVLLLDEPLSALDPETREGVQEELRNLHSILKNTIVHVTHDFEEAMSLGTRVAVIGAGALRQVGTPEQIFRQPASAFVARFALMRNIFRGEISGKSGDQIFHLPGLDLKVKTGIAGPAYAAIRPEDVAVSITPFASSAANTFAGTVTAIVDKGAGIQVSVDLPPVIKSLIMRRQYAEMGLKIGDRVFVALDPDFIHVFKE
jgi:ABC-type Fe3+/spermidine/putrescine transport system ATPase subunit